jgi:hypothetical protein
MGTRAELVRERGRLDSELLALEVDGPLRCTRLAGYSFLLWLSITSLHLILFFLSRSRWTDGRFRYTTDVWARPDCSHLMCG